MTNTKVLNFIAVAAVLMIGSASFAQDNTGGGSTGGASRGNATGMQTDATGDREQRNDDTDYGWLGLLGLAGLAGLLKKPRQEVVHQTEVTRTTPTTPTTPSH